MTLSHVAIKRPVFTVMLMAALAVLGFMGYGKLGTDLFPDVSFPVVAVNVVYPGASPNEVESQVTKEIEDAVVSLNGIDRVRSFSRESLSTVIVIFKLGVDISDAATQVRERVAQARAKLPQDAKEPAVSRFDVAAAPVLIYTLEGSRPLPEIRKYADDVIKPTLEQIDGVASVEVKGGAAREVQVELDRAKLDALHIDPSVVAQHLKAANLAVPGGRFEQGAREVSVRTMGELADVAALREVIVATASDGSAVRLRDVARVEDGYEELRTKVRANGAEAVSFEVLKQSGQNTVAVSDAVQAKLAELSKAFPGDVRTALILDQSKYIKENVAEVKESIFFGGAMAILIILVFMLDLRSTLISAVALPTSVIGTFFAMYLFGYTLNMMTLLALSLAIGLLIDDAIVVRENISKHLERGEDPFTAAENGTKEIALSVLATTLTIVAVFLPVAFIKGMVGQFFRQFGITISAAVMISLFVAFTLDPMLSSRFSKAHGQGTVDRFAIIKRPFELVFREMDEVYRGVLEWAVHHKAIVLGAAVGSLVFMGFVASLTGNEFVNAEDRGQYVLELELPAGTSLAETSRVSKEAELRLGANPLVKTVFSTVGANGEANKAKWRVVTAPKVERPGVPLSTLKDAGRKAVAEIAPTAILAVTDPPFVEGAATEAPIMIDVRGDSYADVAPLATEVANILRTMAGIEDVSMKFSPGRPELQVAVDRQKAADLGLSVAQVGLALRIATEGEEVTKLRQGKDEIPVRVRLLRDDRSESALSQLTLLGPKGPVKLSDVAAFGKGEGPQVIEREGRLRQIQIWAAPRGRPLGEIVAELEPKIRALKLPAGAAITYDGQIKMMTETNTNMGLGLMLGIVFIYIVLASQFESFIHPLTIMLTLPLAIVGAVLGLFLTKNTMAMGAMIGIILLMGLVTKNAILLVDRAIVRVREQGEPPLQAILEAGPERLRPILMTSAAMVLGMLPTAISRGEGSEFRAPMAIAVIGGVISSTLLSLVVVPAFYLTIEGGKARLARLLRGKAAPSPAPGE